jgi:DNA modification methylase
LRDFIASFIIRHLYVPNFLRQNLLNTARSFEQQVASISVFAKETKPKVQKFKDGIVINGKFGTPEVASILEKYEHKLPLIIADPPYGEIVKNDWDKGVKSSDYMSWTLECAKYLSKGASLYMWGGIGKPHNRIFFDWLSKVEEETPLALRNLITWKKRRAYGKKDDYLFTREECAWLVNGEKPRTFNIPLLDVERGYEGFNKDYPAKSKYLRRSNVWTDINELFVGKVHIAQKPERLAEIMIETHTKKGDTVMDPFAGSGSSGLAARRLGREFILIELDPTNFKLIVKRLNDKRDDTEKKLTVKAANAQNRYMWDIESIR